MTNAYNIVAEKPGRKKLLGRPRRRWEENIRMYLRAVVWEGVNWMHVAEVSN